MVVRQFRLLLQAREVLDGGASDAEVARIVGIHPFVAGKISHQARQITLPALEDIYHRLLEMDLAVKTGQLSEELALETLVARLAIMPR
jgi:DNA polymerase-3 subunit delta